MGAGIAPRSFAEFGPLATHLRFVERSARKLARSTFYGMSRWQGQPEKKRAFPGRIVDVGAELFAISAAVVRAQKARLRVDGYFDAQWRNNDKTNLCRSKTRSCLLRALCRLLAPHRLEACVDWRKS